MAIGFAEESPLGVFFSGSTNKTLDVSVNVRFRNKIQTTWAASQINPSVHKTTCYFIFDK